MSHYTKNVCHLIETYNCMIRLLKNRIIFVFLNKLYSSFSMNVKLLSPLLKQIYQQFQSSNNFFFVIIRLKNNLPNSPIALQFFQITRIPF